MFIAVYGEPDRSPHLGASMSEPLHIRFENVSVAEANRLAEDLRRDLLDAGPDIEVERQQDNAENQDFGATLVLILGAPSMVVAAHALKNWATRHNAASVVVTTATGTVVARNLESRDVPSIVAAMTGADGKA